MRKKSEDPGAELAVARARVEQLVTKFEAFAGEQIKLEDDEIEKRKLADSFIKAFDAAHEMGDDVWLGRLTKSGYAFAMQRGVFKADEDDWFERKIRGTLSCVRRCRNKHPPGSAARKKCRRNCFIYMVYCEWA